MTTRKLLLVIFLYLSGIGLLFGIILLVMESSWTTSVPPPPKKWDGQAAEEKDTRSPLPALPDAASLEKLQAERIATAGEAEQKLLANFPPENRQMDSKAFLFTLDAGMKEHSFYHSVFSPDGKIWAGTRHKEIELWDITTKKRIGSLKTKNQDSLSKPMFSPDGKRVVSNTWINRREIIIWDAQTGKELRRISLDGNFFIAMDALAFLPGTNILAVAVGGFPKSQVRFWDVVGGEEFQPLTLSNEAGHLAVAPTGGVLATAGNKQIDLWAYPSFQNLGSFPCGDVNSFSFSPNGKWLVVGGGTQIQLIEVATNQVQKFQTEGESVAWVQFVGKGDVLAWESGNGFSAIRFHAVPSLKTITAAPFGYSNGAFSPGGHLLICANFSSSISFWDVQSMVSAVEENEQQILINKSWSWKGFFLSRKDKSLQLYLTAPTKFSTDNTGVSDLTKAATISKVQTLNLQGKISDAALQLLPKFQELQHLTLEGLTDISGKGLLPLGKLPKLEKLSLWRLPKLRDQDLAPLVHLTQVRELQLLTLSKLTATGLGPLEKMSNLQALSLGNLDNFGGDDLVGLPKLPQVRKLQLHNLPNVDDGDLAQLKQFPNLEVLDLDTLPSVSEAGLEHLQALPKLQVLSFGYGALPEITEKFLGQLAGAKNLRSLKFGATLLSVKCYPQLGKLKQLEELQIGSQLTDSDLGHLAGLTKLQSLNVFGDKLTDTGLAPLAKMTHLKKLWVGGNGLTGAGLKHLQGLKELEDLFFSGGQLESLEALQHLSKLKKLMVFSDKLTDAGLVHLHPLKNLQMVTLYCKTVTPEGAKLLQNALPKAKISHY